MLSPPGQVPDATAQAALSRILEGTASEIGEGFFRVLVENLARPSAPPVPGSPRWTARRLRALAFWLGGKWVEGFEQPIDGTPCQVVIENRRLVHYPDRILELYPDEPNLRRMGAVSYMGVPLRDVDGTVLGHMAVMDTAPMPEYFVRLTLFEIFAGRAAAELGRLRAERRSGPEASSRGWWAARWPRSSSSMVTCGSSDEPAAERTFELPAEAAEGSAVQPGPAEDAAKLEALARALHDRPPDQRSAWVAGGFAGMTAGGNSFPAEATLSLFELDGRRHFTLILRNVDQRLEAERRIVTLTAETEYLRTELRELGRSGKILGRSEQLLRALAEVHQVAATDTTVLILGETGTGKELFARAIHQASRRREKPLVKVNCAAIPASLIESEFFGHERGAFTGATARRDGRFTLADGGTLFRRGGEPAGAAGEAASRPPGGRVRAKLPDAQGERPGGGRDERTLAGRSRTGSSGRICSTG
jgi:hypothetical protein